MKKLIVITGLVLCFSSVFAGGLLTNGNQSAQYIRMLSRNASTSPDAVYFNPAGLMRMENGFYFAVQSQSLFQTKTVESGFPLLNSGKYEGTLAAPIFPTAFAIYKKDKFAFSLGLGPNSGGGSITFDRGLPSFEKDISKLVPGLADLSKIGKTVSGYGVNIYFKGESVYWGIQGGVSYKVNDIFSVYGGLRYLPAKTTYNGYIKDIQVKVNGTLTNAKTFLQNDAAPLLTASANSATGAAASVQPLIAGGAGTLTLAQVQGANYITAAQRTQLETGLLGLGATQAQINAMPLSTVQATFNSGAATLNGKAAALIATGNALADKAVDAEQTGTGITPILGLNISPNKNLNIGIKYEFKTKLTMTNATKVDDLKMFPDKEESASDLPSILSIGADYNVSNAWKLSVSYNGYHDKGVDWGKNVYKEPRVIGYNTWEVALGTQYQVTKKFALSLGYLHTEMYILEQFQSDFSYYSPANTVGGGFEWKATPKFTLDIGALYTKYHDSTKQFTDAAVGTYSETYKKSNLGFALGLAWHFGGMPK
ncbi:MAG: hypothetical protein WCP85_10380 [Mariniphaga sp.]